MEYTSSQMKNNKSYILESIKINEPRSLNKLNNTLKDNMNNVGHIKQKHKNMK